MWTKNEIKLSPPQEAEIPPEPHVDSEEEGNSMHGDKSFSALIHKEVIVIETEEPGKDDIIREQVEQELQRYYIAL